MSYLLNNIMKFKYSRYVYGSYVWTINGSVHGGMDTRAMDKNNNGTEIPSPCRKSVGI